MKYSVEQLLLSARVRDIAFDLHRMERNSRSDKWHAANPGKTREMSEFAAELNKEVKMTKFVLDAVKELEAAADIIFPTPESA